MRVDESRLWFVVASACILLLTAYLITILQEADRLPPPLEDTIDTLVDARYLSVSQYRL